MAIDNGLDATAEARLFVDTNTKQKGVLKGLLKNAPKTRTHLAMRLCAPAAPDLPKRGCDVTCRLLRPAFLRWSLVLAIRHRKSGRELQPPRPRP